MVAGTYSSKIISLNSPLSDAFVWVALCTMVYWIDPYPHPPLSRDPLYTIHNLYLEGLRLEVGWMVRWYWCQFLSLLYFDTYSKERKQCLQICTISNVEIRLRTHLNEWAMPSRIQGLETRKPWLHLPQMISAPFSLCSSSYRERHGECG